jgi:hypothetical protein
MYENGQTDTTCALFVDASGRLCKDDNDASGSIRNEKFID